MTLKFRWLLALVISALLSGCSIFSSQSVLDQAIRVLKSDHINTKKVDWDAVSAEAHALEKQSGTRASIEFVIKRLGERHTYYLPADHPNLAAVYGTSEKSASPEIAQITGLIREGVAIVTVPGFVYGQAEQTKPFIENAGNRIAELAKLQPKGWVIDLRGNDGGNMWAMLAGLSCFFEPGTIGISRDSMGIETPWFVNDDREVGIKARWMSHSQAKQSVPCPPMLSKQRVAVLVGPKTASAGEAVAIALLGRANTILYGNTSAGVATMNGFERLSDGSGLATTISAMLDKTGRAFPSGINPRELDEKGRGVSLSEDGLEVVIGELLNPNR